MNQNLNANQNSVTNIAVMVAGIDEEYQNSILEGIIDCAKSHHANISCFSSFSGVISNNCYDKGEYNIYELCNEKNFDAMILMTNTIGNLEVRAKIIHRARTSGLPIVVLDGEDDEDFYHVRINNTKAMREIVHHIITQHNAQQICFVSGPLANPEARARYQAFLEVMEEHQLPVVDEQVYFGEFRAVDGKKAVEKFMSAGIPTPDAIICANDAMALSVVMELEKHDYCVPDDVIVTGFDNTYNAQHYCPSLTTVARPLNEAGYRACEMLLQAIHHPEKEIARTISLDAYPVFAESCGCCRDLTKNIRQYKKSTFQLIDDCRSNILLLNQLTSQLSETETIQENFKVIQHFIDQLECEQYCICLCSEWEGVFGNSYTQGTDDAYQIQGYTKHMSAPLIWNNGEFSTVQKFSSADLFPVPMETGGNISYFLPLHFRERCLGYYIITNSDFPIKSMLCHSLMLSISNSIENIRKLIHLNKVIQELDKLYVLDPMCSIYNRNGFIRVTDKLLKQCKAEERSILVSFIDMDGLKLINDHYGHKEGDFALQRLATIIQELCDENSVCARFGGDEFIIFSMDCDEDDAEKLENRLYKKIAETNSIIMKPYEIDASIGTITAKVNPDDKLFELITQADSLMYEQKKRKKTSRYLRQE
ncbi:MAG: GGDEF domain-containing protein [Oscillospiraceae bacterium]|nr:GGDEF domain-containing protein [Oscillospiraceae bacterium]